MKIIFLLMLVGQPQPDEEEQYGRRLGWGVEPRAALWRPNLNGRAVADQAFGAGPVIEGSSVKLDDDLDIGDEDAFGYYELGFTDVVGAGGDRVSVERMTVSFWMHRWEGDSSLDSTETFNGVTFSAGENVESEFDIWSFGLDGAVPIEVYAGPEGTFSSAFTFGLRYIEVEIDLSAPGRDTDERTRLLYLGGGFRTEWKPGRHFFGALSGGVYASLGSVESDLDWAAEDWAAIATEGAASMGFEFARLRVEAGFRIATNAIAVEREDSDTFEDNGFSYFLGGPFLQVSVRW